MASQATPCLPHPLSHGLAQPSTSTCAHPVQTPGSRWFAKRAATDFSAVVPRHAAPPFIAPSLVLCPMFYVSSVCAGCVL